jgi:hypothetical protein
MVQCEITGFQEALAVLDLMQLPAALKRRWLARKGRMVILQARKNIADQKTVGGSRFTPRSRKSRKTGPMLVGLGKTKWIGLKLLSDEEAEVFFPSKMIKKGDTETRVNQGYLARKHQDGTDENFRRENQDTLFAADERDPAFRPYWRDYCNKAQASELIRCGFGRPRKWIMENVTVGHAYQWLRSMPAAWAIKVPARPFLGASDELLRRFGDELRIGLRERFRAKNHANLLQ